MNITTGRLIIIQSRHSHDTEDVELAMIEEIYLATDGTITIRIANREVRNATDIIAAYCPDAIDYHYGWLDRYGYPYDGPMGNVTDNVANYTTA